MARRWLGLGLLGVSLAAGATGPAEWLVEMSQAVRSTNYEGVMIFRSESSLETFRVTHRYQSGEARERVQSLTGEPREILRVGDTVTCLLPRNRRLSSAREVPQSLFPVLTVEQVARIAEVYELRDLGEQRIAGRRCQGVAIAPRDRFRYGYEIWADSETRVPVKVTLRDPDGRTLEQMMFTEVHFPDSIPDSAFLIDPERSRELEPVVSERAPPPSTLVALGGESVAQDARESRWQLHAVPRGFELVMHVQRSLPQGRGRLQHWVLSDGLTAVSVFGREGAAGAMPIERPFSAMGAVNAYRRSLESLQITVVGEVPQDTIRYIADGVGPADAVVLPTLP
jgi:sigma-E factor negative regulatory protein RseB